MQQLYLVQHGEALSKADDPERPLTPQGRDDVARTAALAHSAGVQVYEVRHSGKLRAEQTALILAEFLHPQGGVSALGGLVPNGDVRPIAERLKRESRPLMFVGHLPFMERLAGLLVAGDPERLVVRFQRGGIVCLERDAGAAFWSVSWAVPPDLLCEQGLGDSS